MTRSQIDPRFMAAFRDEFQPATIIEDQKQGAALSNLDQLLRRLDRAVRRGSPPVRIC